MVLTVIITIIVLLVVHYAGYRYGREVQRKIDNYKEARWP